MVVFPTLRPQAMKGKSVLRWVVNRYTRAQYTKVIGVESQRLRRIDHLAIPLNSLEVRDVDVAKSLKGVQGMSMTRESALTATVTLETVTNPLLPVNLKVVGRVLFKALQKSSHSSSGTTLASL